MATDPQRPRVHVFYDYVCPYAYLGWLRAQRLAAELDVEFVWLPWEIYPTTDPPGEPYEPGSHSGDVPDWFGRLAAELDVELNGPDMGVNSNLALRGAELAKDRGPRTFQAYHEAAFEAIWKEGRNLGDEAVLRDVAKRAELDPDAFLDGIRHHAYQARLDAIDEAAGRLGVQRVPTFVFGDQRIVGNDPFEGSLRAPLEAFLERWKVLGAEHATTLADDVDLERVLLG